MGLHRFLLVALATLLVSARALLVTKETKLSLVDRSVVTVRDDINQGRSLRVAKNYDEKNNVTGEGHSTTAEERTNPIVSKIASIIPLWMKIPVWLERRKPAEYVQKKLGMEGLTGAHLKNHPNYPRLEKYIDDLEKNELWKLARNGFDTTFKMWNHYGWLL